MMDRQAMATLTEELPTKAAKIRALAKRGVKRADIARFLDIRYQHVRNVLMQAPLRSEGTPNALPAFPQHPQIDDRWSIEIARENLAATGDGSLSVPKCLLNAAGIKPGDVVLARVVDGEVRLSGYAASLSRGQWIAAHFHVPGRSEVDDFIAERRALGARGE